MIPNLFIVGFQKCGSSSLFDILIKHPQISGSFPKETFALVDKGYDNYWESKHISASDFNWDIFFNNKKKGVRYALEASVCNFYQKTALDYISKIEGAKVIFIVRDPIERLRSTYDYYTPKLKTDVGSISQYIKILKEQNLKKGLNIDGAKYALEHGKYSDYISTWENTLGNKHIHVLSFNQLIRNAPEELKKIENFLHIAPFSSYEVPHKNKSRNISNRKLHYILKKNLKFLNLSRTSPLFKVYKSLNFKTQKTIIPRNDKIFLQNYYTKEIEYINKFDNIITPE